jgi:cytochrome c-type biogenesis protein CcmH
MTAFAIIAVLLAAGALALVLPALLGRRAARDGATSNALNAALYRDQLRELEADLAAGLLDAGRYEEARREIERRLLEDVGAEAPSPAARPGRATAVAVGIALPLASALLYLAVGNPLALGPAADPAHAHAGNLQQLEAMVERLAARMRESPEDAEGWAMLGRSYAVLGRHAESAAAYANAVKRSEPDAQLLADYADALAMAQGRNLLGEPERIVAMALKLDPDNVKALALAGTAAFEKRDFGGAVAHWERILKLVPPDTELAESVRSSVAEARRNAAEARGGPGRQAAAAAPAAGVSGTVRITPALAAKAAPGDTVFIFARPADGSRMPLAVVRRQVRDLPAAFSLDDSTAMSPAAPLSAHERVVVGARVSKSGSPTPAAGDLEGLSAPVRLGQSGIVVTIDREIAAAK